MLKASPKQYWTIIAPKTAVEAFESQSMSVALMRKEMSEVVTKAFLMYIVTDLVESFNVGKTMDAMQAAFTVNGIIADYWFLKPEELKYCFNEAKKGRYGTMYDRIDAAVIFGWIETFLKERTQICYQKNEEQNKQYNTGTIHPDVAAKLKLNIKQPEPVNLDLITPKKREQTEQEKIIQDLFKEFDELYKEQNKTFDDTGFRVVLFKGELLSSSQYISTRIEEILNDKKNKKD